MDFLTNLDFLLKSRNLKRADLARALDIAPSTISSWYIRGSEKINIDLLKRIAAFFDVSLEELINGKPYNKESNVLTFSASEYTEQELLLIKNFAKMLKDSRKETK